MQLIDAKVNKLREEVINIQTVDKRTDEYQRLVASIKKRGILSPLLVREIKYTHEPMFYAIVDGVARFYAAQDLGLETVPVVVTTLTDTEMLEVQLIKSLQRFPVKRINYAMSLARLLSIDPSVSLAKFADRIHVSPEWVLKTLKLDTHLNPKLLPDIYNGKINLSNAYALAKLPKKEQVDFKKKSISLPASEFSPHVWARVKEVRAARRGN
jgi:ParB family chromosome partitioning protein